jgi:hypothetical protein
MLLEESGASSPDSGTGQPHNISIANDSDELAQLEQLEKEMEEDGGQPLVRRSVSHAERQRLEKELAELARLEAQILRRSVRACRHGSVGSWLWIRVLNFFYDLS